MGLLAPSGETSGMAGTGRLSHQHFIYLFKNHGPPGAYPGRKENEKMYTDLQELTGQESGIVMYGKEGILCNWANINGLPRLFASGMVGMGEEIPEVEGNYCTDLSGLLMDVNIIIAADYDDDDMPKSGTIYRLGDDIIVVAPDGWI